LACGDQRRLTGSGSALEVVLHDYALYKSTFTYLSLYRMTIIPYYTFRLIQCSSDNQCVLFKLGTHWRQRRIQHGRLCVEIRQSRPCRFGPVLYTQSHWRQSRKDVRPRATKIIHFRQSRPHRRQSTSSSICRHFGNSRLCRQYVPGFRQQSDNLRLCRCVVSGT